MIKLVNDVMDIYNQHYVSYGDYSVTTLISPPRVVQLTRRYGDQCVKDPNAQIGSFIGTAVHELIEKCLRQKYAGDDQIQLEKTVAFPFTVGKETRIVSGKFDILYVGDSLDLHDNKVVNVWKLVFDPQMKEWHEQQNIYAYLLHLRGVDINNLYINAWYKDWIENKTLRDKSYPQTQTAEYRLNLWPWEQTEKLLMERLTMHVEAETTADEDLPLCTYDEMFEQPTVYALMKDKRAKRSTKNFKTMEEALKSIPTIKGVSANSYIEIRRGRRKRCDKYCHIRDYCNQYVDYAKRCRKSNLIETMSLKGVL